MNFSCLINRFALGFSAQDYPNSNHHTGQTMAINLDLGLSEEQLDDLTKELFHLFDKGNTTFKKTLSLS